MLCLAQKDERYKNEKTKKVVLLTAPLAQGGGDVRPIARPKLLDQFQKLGVLLQGELSEIRRQEIVVPGSNLVGVKVCSPTQFYSVGSLQSRPGGSVSCF